jgi:hypothetical protein
VHPQSEGVRGSAASQVVVSAVLDNDLDTVLVGELERCLDLGRRLDIDVVVCHASLDTVALDVAILRRNGRDRAACIRCLTDAPVTLSDHEVTSATARPRMLLFCENIPQ